MSDYASLIAQELGLRPAQAGAVIRLLDEGATVPFIARYRKEATGSLDEVAVTAIRDRLAAGRELDKRREAIVASLEERNLLTPELRAKVEAAASLTLLEDIYLPYRPKRRTRASAARERGLEPLADLLARQERCLPETLAAGFVAPDKDVADAEAALAGARDILAERFAEDQTARERLRGVFGREGLMRCKAASGKEDDPDAAKYQYRSDFILWPWLTASVTEVWAAMIVSYQVTHSPPVRSGSGSGPGTAGILGPLSGSGRSGISLRPPSPRCPGL